MGALGFVNISVLVISTYVSKMIDIELLQPVATCVLKKIP